MERGLEIKMENHLETGEVWPADCIVVLGRGIEQAETATGPKWKPTRSVEKLSEAGQHGGTRVRGLSPDDEGNVVVAGANANVIASVELCQELQRAGLPHPGLVIFAAGRPAYLENDPDDSLSEGKILAEKFKSTMKEHHAADAIVLDKNKNTQDDIVESLRSAGRAGLKKVVFITIALHKDRAEEFLKIVCEKNPELRTIESKFIASEDLLLKRYANDPTALKLFTSGLERLKQSEAWKRTEEREKKGLRDLRLGTYRSLQEVIKPSDPLE